MGILSDVGDKSNLSDIIITTFNCFNQVAFSVLAILSDVGNTVGV